MSAVTAPLPAGEALEPVDAIDATALALARRWNLVCENGEIVCMRAGCDQVATLPGLLCAEHLRAHRRGWR